jgi:hypothetical protein
LKKNIKKRNKKIRRTKLDIKINGIKYPQIKLKKTNFKKHQKKNKL